MARRKAEAGLDATGGAEGFDLLIVEDTRADEEADAFSVVEREHAAAAGNYVEGELGVLPIFELAFAHVEGLAIDFSELDIGVAGDELATGIAHGGAAVAAAAGLMEHQRAVLLAQDADEVDGEIGGLDLDGESGHGFQWLVISD